MTNPWADEATARRIWADAPVESDDLQYYLDLSYEAIYEYAPPELAEVWASGSVEVPLRITQAVILQAAEAFQAPQRNGSDVIGLADTGYAVRVSKLSGAVKQLVRPRRPSTSFGTPGSEIPTSPERYVTTAAFLTAMTAAAAASAAAIAAAEDAAADALAASEATAAATFAPFRLGAPTNRYVSLGDSVDLGSTDNTFHALGPAWPVYAALISQQRIHLVYDAGVAGNTSAQMLARFDTDVAPWEPTVVSIGAGTNDTGQSVPLATFQANLQAIVAKVHALGARPVFRTIPPRDTGGLEDTIALWNAWLRRYAESIGATVLDAYRLWVDPATGHYAAAYVSDGVHPNEAGQVALGRLAAAALGPLLPSNAPTLPLDDEDASNLLTNPLFLANSGVVTPTGWTVLSAPTGIARLVAAAALVSGNMWTATATASSGLYGIKQATAVTAGFAPGDVMAVTGVITSDGGVAATVKVQDQSNANVAQAMNQMTAALDRAVFYLEFVVPTGTTALNVLLQLAAGTGIVGFGQVGLYNLTEMGLA